MKSIFNINNLMFRPNNTLGFSVLWQRILQEETSFINNEIYQIRLAGDIREKENNIKKLQQIIYLTLLMKSSVICTYFNNIIDPPYTCCPIICEDFEENAMVVIMKTCGHLYDLQGFRTWINTKTSCPMCRHPLQWNTMENEKIVVVDTEKIFL